MMIYAIEQRIFKFAHMLIVIFFRLKFGNFWHTTCLFTTNRHKLSTLKNSPVYSGPPCITAVIMPQEWKAAKKAIITLTHWY